MPGSLPPSLGGALGAARATATFAGARSLPRRPLRCEHSAQPAICPCCALLRQRPGWPHPPRLPDLQVTGTPSGGKPYCPGRARPGSSPAGLPAFAPDAARWQVRLSSRPALTDRAGGPVSSGGTSTGGGPLNRLAVPDVPVVWGSDEAPRRGRLGERRHARSHDLVTRESAMKSFTHASPGVRRLHADRFAGRLCVGPDRGGLRYRGDSPGPRARPQVREPGISIAGRGPTRSACGVPPRVPSQPSVLVRLVAYGLPGFIAVTPSLTPVKIHGQ
jgi:hypothetical protein